MDLFAFQLLVEHNTECHVSLVHRVPRWPMPINRLAHYSWPVCDFYHDGRVVLFVGPESWGGVALFPVPPLNEKL